VNEIASSFPKRRDFKVYRPAYASIAKEWKYVVAKSKHKLIDRSEIKHWKKVNNLSIRLSTVNFTACI
jgi:hypothetical protein